jgi:hypothetical protein
MSNPTSNFGWQMPTPTDLVTDLPADFEVFGQAVDTSLADLKGGTSGQVLSKNSNTDMDFVWVTSDDANAIQNTIVDAKGDLIGATAADTPARLAVGTNGQVLTADSTAATGLAWATAPSGGMTLLGTATPSGGEIKFTSISSSYNQLVLIVEDWYTSGGAEAGVRLNNDTTTANYGTVGMYGNTAAVTSYYKTGFSFVWMTGAAGGTTDVDNVSVVTFPNYADTNSHKVFYGYTKHVGASNGLHITHAAGAYTSTSAISTISFYPAGGNMNGTAYLYGVK